MSSETPLKAVMLRAWSDTKLLNTRRTAVDRIRFPSSNFVGAAAQAATSPASPALELQEQHWKSHWKCPVGRLVEFLKPMVTHKIHEVSPAVYRGRSLGSGCKGCSLHLGRENGEWKMQLWSSV